VKPKNGWIKRKERGEKRDKNGEKKKLAEKGQSRSKATMRNYFRERGMESRAGGVEERER
jgi:hypothetical protein